MKTDEVIELPEQIEQNIFLKATKEYRQFVKDGYLLLDGVELVGDNTLTKMLYARQLCGQYHLDKLYAFRDLIISTGERVIVFYNFTEELNRMQYCLVELNRPFSVLNGSTKDLTAYENDVDSVTFIQYQAGAMGGNFQKANKIVYFTLPLGKGSCDLWEQSKKRIHRIGQKSNCFYYYLLVRNSIEESNFKSLKEGRDYTDELFKKS
jgi:SNF2 family DNA or RNA helicase